MLCFSQYLSDFQSFYKSALIFVYPSRAYKNYPHVTIRYPQKAGQAALAPSLPGTGLCRIVHLVRATPRYKTQNRNNKNIPNALSYKDPYQVRRGRGRPGPLFGDFRESHFGVIFCDRRSPQGGKRKSAPTHRKSTSPRDTGESTTFYRQKIYRLKSHMLFCTPQSKNWQI